MKIYRGVPAPGGGANTNSSGGGGQTAELATVTATKATLSGTSAAASVGANLSTAGSTAASISAAGVDGGVGGSSISSNGNNGAAGDKPVSYLRREVSVPYLAVGESTGAVHILELHPEFGASTEVGMKKKNQSLFASSTQYQQAACVAAHTDWITQMRFVIEVTALVVASMDGTISLVDVNRNCVLKVFTEHEGSRVGVKALSWSAFGKYIVSAAERTVLFWDAFTLDRVMRIDALKSPVVQVEVHDTFNKVIAILSNKTVMVWHNITFELLQQFTDPTEYKPEDVLTAMTFAPDIRCLFTAGNRITCWNLERYFFLLFCTANII